MDYISKIKETYLKMLAFIIRHLATPHCVCYLNPGISYTSQGMVTLFTFFAFLGILAHWLD